MRWQCARAGRTGDGLLGWWIASGDGELTGKVAASRPDPLQARRAKRSGAWTAPPASLSS